jgi:hypothetical protein
MRSPNAATIPSLHAFPPEIRREIYGYVALDEQSWIGVPSTLDARLARLASENENDSQGDGKINLNTFLRRTLMGCLKDNGSPEGLTYHHPRPTTFIKTTSNLVRTCSQTRDEYREFLWRSCIDNLHLDSYVEVRVHNFRTKDIEAFTNSWAMKEMMRLSEKRRAPKRNKLRIHMDLSYTFPRWIPHLATPLSLIALTVFLGNDLAALLERLGLSAITPKRLVEMREIALLARWMKCGTTEAMVARGARVVRKPIQEWMAFVRRTRLRADYVVDEPTKENKLFLFDRAMSDERAFVRDYTWTSLDDAVWLSEAEESAFERVRWLLHYLDVGDEWCGCLFPFTDTVCSGSGDGLTWYVVFFKE